MESVALSAFLRTRSRRVLPPVEGCGTCDALLEMLASGGELLELFPSPGAFVRVINSPIRLPRRPEPKEKSSFVTCSFNED